MKALRNLIAFCAIAGMAAFFTGCGDDSGDNNNNNNNTGPQFAPATAQGFAGNTYNVQLANGQTATLAFPTSTTYSLTPQGGTAETGQISALNRQGEDWVGTLTPADANGTARAGELRVHFTSKNGNNSAGTITYQGANGPVTVPFTATSTTGGTTAGTTAGGTTTGTTAGGTTTGTTAGGTTAGTTAGGTTSGTTSGGTGTLVGKTLQLTYANGQGEKFVFTTANQNGNSISGNATYEDKEQATYTYDTGSGLFTFNRPGGQKYQLIVPNGSTTGTTTVGYQEPGGNPSSDPASFTLH